jgi:hypothetical protein
VTVDLFVNSGKQVVSACKLVKIEDTSVTLSLTGNAPIDVKVNVANSCVQITNVASNAICAKNSPMHDINTVSLDLNKICIPI